MVVFPLFPSPCDRSAQGNPNPHRHHLLPMPDGDCFHAHGLYTGHPKVHFDVPTAAGRQIFSTQCCCGNKEPTVSPLRGSRWDQVAAARSDSGPVIVVFVDRAGNYSTDYGSPRINQLMLKVLSSLSRYACPSRSLLHRQCSISDLVEIELFLFIDTWGIVPINPGLRGMHNRCNNRMWATPQDWRGSPLLPLPHPTSRTPFGFGQSMNGRSNFTPGLIMRDLSTRILMWAGHFIAWTKSARPSIDIFLTASIQKCKVTQL